MPLNYDPNEDGELAHYVADERGGEQFEDLAEGTERTNALAEKEKWIAELESTLQEMMTAPNAIGTRANDGSETARSSARERSRLAT